MTAVFADTFYFLALLDSRDGAHARALAITSQIRFRIITTAWVLTELANSLTSPGRNREIFVEFFDKLQENPSVTIHLPSDELFRQGIVLYRSRMDKSWSLTDCISFVVMEQEGLREALTGDHHFEQAGFIALLS